MPLYSYVCQCGDSFEVYCTYARFRSKRRCKSCNRLASVRIYAPELSGVQISDQTRKILSVPFGRKAASEFKTTEDVRRTIRQIEKKYAHFGKGIDRPSKDSHKDLSAERDRKLQKAVEKKLEQW